MPHGEKIPREGGTCSEVKGKRDDERNIQEGPRWGQHLGCKLMK